MDIEEIQLELNNIIKLTTEKEKEREKKILGALLTIIPFQWDFFDLPVDLIVAT